MRLCRENGIPLILVRGKTISFVEIPKPSGLDGYILELKDHLMKNGVRFADLEGMRAWAWRTTLTGSTCSPKRERCTPRCWQRR